MPRPSKTRLARGDSGGDSAPCAPVLDLSSHIPTKVAVFANRLQRSASRYYRERYGIGVVEWRLVMFIGYVMETRANHICSETDLDKGAVSRSLNTLQRMGLVRVVEDGTDSRRNNVTLTAKGRVLHDEMVPVALDRQSDLVADLTQAEIELFTKLIDRMQAKVADGEPGPDEPLGKLAVPAAALPARAPRRAKPRTKPQAKSAAKSSARRRQARRR